MGAIKKLSEIFSRGRGVRRFSSLSKNNKNYEKSLFNWILRKCGQKQTRKRNLGSSQRCVLLCSGLSWNTQYSTVHSVHSHPSLAWRQSFTEENTKFARLLTVTTRQKWHGKLHWWVSDFSSFKEQNEQQQYQNTYHKKSSTNTFLSLDLTKLNTVRWSWTKYTPGKTNSNQCEECPKSDFIYKLSLFCSNCWWSKDIHRKEKRPTVQQALCL